MAEIYPPYVCDPLSDSAYFDVYDAAGTHPTPGMMAHVKAAADISADDDLFALQWRLPNPLPSGLTGKLLVITRANATSGVIALQNDWKCVSDAQNPDAIAFNAEGGTELDITTATTAHERKATKQTLDADTLVADETLFMQIAVDDSAHTIAVVTGLEFWLLFE